MNVIMIAPGYPGEMPYFCRGLAQQGARVYGVSDVPEPDLPSLAREHLSGYLRVPNLSDEAAVVAAVQGALTLVALLVLRVPGAFLWGLVATICSVLPVVGTTPVTIGAALYLGLSGHPGKAAAMVAAALFIGPATVRTHLSNLYGKLEVGSHTAAVVAARRHGIL